MLISKEKKIWGLKLCYAGIHCKHLQCKVWALASKTVAVVVKLVLGSGLNLLKKVDDQSTSYTVGLLYRGYCKVNVVDEFSGVIPLYLEQQLNVNSTVEL